MRELSIQLNVYPIAKMRQDIYRFIADEFTFSPVPEDSEPADATIVIKRLQSIFHQLTLSVIFLRASLPL